MPTPILATKLYIPRPRPNVVSRPRLLERLNEGLHRKLTLISAPAGFGKTTLVSEWLAGCGRPAAWLSLDAGDNDPARFLTYLVAALQTIAATIGAGMLGVLHSPQPPPPEALLTALLNDITTCTGYLDYLFENVPLHVDKQHGGHGVGSMAELIPNKLRRDDSHVSEGKLPAEQTVEAGAIVREAVPARTDASSSQRRMFLPSQTRNYLLALNTTARVTLEVFRACLRQSGLHL